MPAQPAPPGARRLARLAAGVRPLGKLLLSATGIALLAVATAGCAMSHDSSAGPGNRAWPFGEDPRPQPETVDEWMGQERPGP